MTRDIALVLAGYFCGYSLATLFGFLGLLNLLAAGIVAFTVTALWWHAEGRL